MDPILSSFERQFCAIDRRSRELVSKIGDGRLFERTHDASNSTDPLSCGECIIRSAAMVEKTFNGITTRLWDDPFEWTLPESMNSKKAVLDYLDEVEATRRKGLGFLMSDADLRREMPAPESLRPIADILIDAISRAEHYQGRAFAVFQMLTAACPPRL